MIADGAALVLFARVPRPGAVKTRLTPWLTPAEALDLHRALLEDSLALLRRAAAPCGARPVVSFSEPWHPGADDAAGPLAAACSGLDLLPQRGGDLGERLEAAFADLRAAGDRPVVVIGSDSPTLPAERIVSAFALLRSGAEVVLGPAEDGGFYLIGAGRAGPGLLAGVPWGTRQVLEATERALSGAGVRPVRLPPWYDVDLPADLERLRSDPAAPSSAARTTALLARLRR
ncbi:MAG: glycosyltransferase [Acidobacteria bacterium]|nr:MAG: glycosyltransferase [Acidobacteriota bacterium]